MRLLLIIRSSLLQRKRCLLGRRSQMLVVFLPERRLWRRRLDRGELGLHLDG